MTMTTRPSTAAQILAVLAIGLAMLSGYMAGYFWLGERHNLNATYLRGPVIVRLYPQEWVAVAYRPMAGFEQWMSGTIVSVRRAPSDESEVLEYWDE
jgi:hypothetical protein